MELTKKILRKLPTGYRDDAATFSDERLRAEVLQAETNIKRVEGEKTEDERLSGAKELVKDLSRPYSDAIAAQRAKISYVMYLLAEKGQLPMATISVKDDEDEDDGASESDEDES